MGKHKYFLTWGGLALAVLLLFAVNIFSSTVFTSARIDLTQNRLYTLTPGTLKILDALQETVTLRLFLSQEQATRIPGISSYAQRVKELLREYARLAGGVIKLHIIDPEPFSEEEDLAESYGVRGVALDEAGTQFYFGLVGTNSTDDEEIIPFFAMDREEFLEHDLTKLIYKLSSARTPTVGLLSSLPLDGGMPSPQAMAMGLEQGMDQPWIVLDQMQQLFEVNTIAADADRIPPDINVLMVVHPKQLPPTMLYAIDQYVLAGGRALVFVDPNAEADRAPGMMGMGSPPGSSDLGNLFAAWGIELVAGKVAGDLSVAERVRFGQQQNQGVVDYPVWMNLPADLFNPDDVVTSNLGNLVIASPGILNDLGKDGIKVTPLVWTTENAKQFDISQLRFVTDPSVLIAGYQPGGERLNLALRVSGRVATAFEHGPPPSPEPSQPVAEQKQAPAGQADDPPAPHLQRSLQEVNLIIVADSDMLSDEYWAQAQNFLGTRMVIPTASNGDFVINALDSLLGSNDLISVRSRGQFSRPFTKVAEIQQAAEIQYRQKERELLAGLQEAENRLLELEQGKQSEQSLILSEAQEQEIAKFRQEKLRIRGDLRHVRHQLHKDIERLESATKFINIGLVPLIIGVGGLLLGISRGRG